MGFGAGLAVESSCPCLRRGTFCSHRKYPKDAQEAAWFLDFLSGRQARVSVGRGLNFASSPLNTVVSTDPRPLRDRQSGHFLANAETILHLRPLAKFSKRVGRMITTFPAWGALRISKPWFWRRFLHTFCRCWQKVCRRRPRLRNHSLRFFALQGKIVNFLKQTLKGMDISREISIIQVLFYRYRSDCASCAALCKGEELCGISGEFFERIYGRCPGIFLPWWWRSPS